MDKTSFFEFNQPEYTDPVDIAKLNANMDKIDSALFAGLCKKKVTGNSIGDGTQIGSPKGWPPFFEIKNANETEVVVTDRSFSGKTYTIPAGGTHREYIGELYPQNFIASDNKDVEYSYFIDAETRINEMPSGSGSVTSVTVNPQNNSHLTTSGSPIVDSGTITIGVSSGYEIPETSKQTAWDSKAADIKFEINSSTYVLTAQLKDSSGNLIGTEKTIDLPLETMVVDGEYDSTTQKIKLELKNGNYVEFSVAALVSGLQTELSASNKLDPDYIDYDSTHSAVTAAEKTTWNSKQDALTFDSAPISGSDNPVKSSGVYSALSSKVDVISGKGLSTEDYTTAEKNKLSGIEANANNYTHPTTSGNKHIPSGGSSGKILGWAADGTAEWITPASGGGAVSGVKGDAESTYRTGDVNLTPANIGAATSDHTHGNITNDGKLQTTDVSIASGDKLVITDSSDSSKVARASVSFDGSTSSQCLTKAGTWASFNYYTHPSDGDTGYYGPSSNASPGVGGSFSVPYLHINSKGHVDVAYTRSITLPSNASTSSSGFMSYDDKTMVNNLGGQSISAANFNNLKTPGCYWIPSTGSSNMPWKNGEKVHLLVYKPDPSSTQNIVQIARAINYPKQMFIRTCYNGTWTNWFKFEGTEVTS